MMGGFLLALIVAVADFYFLFKKLFRLEREEHAEALLAAEKRGASPDVASKPKSKQSKKQD
jgi:hypothetical protein